MDGTENEQQKFWIRVLDCKENWEPVERVQDRCDMLMFPRAGEETGSSILHKLEPAYGGLIESNVQSTTVVQT